MRKRLSLDAILDMTLQKCEVTRDVFFDNIRKRDAVLVRCRSFFSYFAHERYEYSFSEIGRFIGKSHASIIGYVHDILYYIEIYEDFNRTYRSILKALEKLEVNLPIDDSLAMDGKIRIDEDGNKQVVLNSTKETLTIPKKNLTDAHDGDSAEINIKIK